jgi:hypothetical protein
VVRLEGTDLKLGTAEPAAQVEGREDQLPPDALAAIWLRNDELVDQGGWLVVEEGPPCCEVDEACDGLAAPGDQDARGGLGKDSTTSIVETLNSETGWRLAVHVLDQLNQELPDGGQIGFAGICNGDAF